VVANDTTTRLKENATQSSFIRLSLAGPDLKRPDEKQTLNLLKSIDETLDIKPVVPREQNTVSFEIRNPNANINDSDGSNHTDVRSRIYLKIKETDWIMTELAKESQALEKIFQELTREDA